MYEKKIIDKHEYKILTSSYKGIMKWGSCNNLYNKWINE